MFKLLKINMFVWLLWCLSALPLFALAYDLNHEQSMDASVQQALVIIDQAVPDISLFYQQLKQNTQIREIDSRQDGMQQLRNILAQYRDLKALHIVSHADDGFIYLGNSRLSIAQLSQQIKTDSTLNKALKPGADLLFYGCNLARGPLSQAALAQLAQSSGLDIAASTDLTGGSKHNGNWSLEFQRGDIESTIPFNRELLQHYQYVLTTSTFTGLGGVDSGGTGFKTLTDVNLVVSNEFIAANPDIYLNDNATTTLKTMTIKADGVDAESFDVSAITLYAFNANGISIDSTSTIVFKNKIGDTIQTMSLSGNKSMAQNVDKDMFSMFDVGTTSPVVGVAQIDFNFKINGCCANGNNFSSLTYKNITYTNVTAPSVAPTISAVTYDSSTGNMVVTGTNFDAKTGGANDVTVNKFTITGEGGGGSAYTLTSATNIERDSATQFTIPLSGTDKLRVDALLNKSGTSADDSTTYNLAAADDFIANTTAGDTAIATKAITVSNYANPAISSATYDASTGLLVVTGTNFSAISGATNDVVANTFTFTGDGGDTYTLTDSANVDVTSATAFTLTLSSTDKRHVNGILNKNGLNAGSGQAYNLAVADNWMAGGAANANIADSAATITVSNVTAPTITSAVYNSGLGILAVNGSNFTAKVGANNDIDVTKLTITGEGANTYTLTTTNVELTSATAFSITLNATDKVIVNGLFNKNGNQADDGATNYNVAAADHYLAAADTATNIADATNGVTVSNVKVPTISLATYNAGTKTLVVTGTAFARKVGASNDIDVTKLSLSGEAGNSYTLTTASVEIDSETQFTVVLSDTDKINVNGLLNKDGGTSGDNTTYNLAGAEDWQAGVATNAVVADTAGNGVTVSNTQLPTITLATYDYATGILVVTGTNMVKKSGVTNDIDVTKLILKGEAAGTRTLTTSNVELTSETTFSVTLNSADKTAVNALLNKNGTLSDDNTTYNLNAAEDWMAGAAASANVVDASGNGITVSNVPVPTITSATYDFATGVVVVTGTDFQAKTGVTNDVTANLFTFTGEAGGTYTLTDTANVEIDSSTQFTLTLSTTDQLAVNGLLNKNGAQADSGTNYNLAAADNFIANITVGNTADTTGNTITVSSVSAPTVTLATYDFATGALAITGTNFSTTTGANNDLDPTKFTLTGDSGGTYVLTTTGVDLSSLTSATITLNATDKLNVNGLLNKNGLTAGSGTTYNLAAADNWLAGGAPNTDIADGTGNGITVSNVTAPAVTSATYNSGTGVLAVTGTNFAAKVGAGNDIDVTKLTLTGEAGNTHTLTTANVELTDATTFSVTLNAADKVIVNGLLNKNGTQADDGATNYNLAAADNYLAAADTATNIADATSSATVSNVQVPTITSATYNAGTKTLVVTGTAFARKSGATNDIDVTKLSLSGEAGNSYTLTDTANVEIDSETQFTLVLSDTDKINVNGLLNKDGTTSGDNTTYNLAGAENWQAGAATNAVIVDTAGNGITVSNTQTPTITSATYDYATGILAVTGTNMVKKSGGTNDIDVTKLIIKGEASGTRTLTTSNVELTSETAFSVTLNSADKTAVNALLNKSGTASVDSTTYNLNAAEDWMAGAAAAANVVDATGNGITVSNVPVPVITSATYNFTTGVMVVTGADFEAKTGGTNDVTANLFTLTGEAGGTYTLTDTANVEIDNATQFTLTLSAADKVAVNGLLNKNGTTADSSTTYNLAAADNFIANVTAGNTADTTGNGITVSNVSAPTITSATYDYATAALVVTGTNFTRLSGATNDVDPTKFTLTGDAAATYTLTTSALEITNETTFTVPLNAADKLNINGLLNKNGTTSGSGTTYNLAAADNWMAGAAANTDIADATGNGITVSNVSIPTITSATYDFATGVLVVTGTGLVKEAGVTNDVDTSKLTLLGDASGTYTLTTTSVEITDASTFSVTLSTTDKNNVNGLLNKNGTSSGNSTTYNLAAADNWMAGADANAAIADLTGNGITVSNVSIPAITSGTYNATTGVLVVTGTNFVNEVGANNDVVVTKITLKGEAAGTYVLTSSDVEISSATSFSVTLNAADKLASNGLLNKNGTTSGDNTTYNLAVATRWMAGSDATVDSADAVNAVTVSNTPTPTITSATYNALTGVLAVTASGLVAKSGVTNDIDVTKLTLTGDGAVTHTLTSSNVEISSETAFSVTLNSADKLAVNGLLNKDGTTSGDNTTYNLAAAEDWLAGAAASATIADLAGNGVTVSNVANPTITSATYDFGTGVLVVSGSNFVAKNGVTNDVDPTKLTITGEGNNTYTLTTTGVEITSASAFTVTLNTADKNSIGGLLNKNGTQSDSATSYNLAAADNWMAGANASVDIADATGNGITVSNVANPTLTSALYNTGTGQLILTGTNFVAKVGATNDVDPTKFTLTGEAGGTYILTTTGVEITNSTQALITLNASDKTSVNGLLNKNGTQSDSGTSYNIAAADNWIAGAAASQDIADLTGNGVTVSGVVTPTITSATYDGTTGVLTVSGTSFAAKSGAANDVDVTKLTITGEASGTHVLTTTNVEISSETSFSVTLNAADKLLVNGLLNKNGTSSGDATTYNLAGADNWLAGAAASTDLTDATNAITVSNVAVPTITSATYNAATGVLITTGTNLVSKSGANNDVVVNKLTLKGEASGTYTLTTGNVDVTSATAFSITLNAADQLAVNGLLNKNGTSADDATVYNLAAAEDWLAGTAASATIADLTANGITVSNVAVPTITSATYNAATGAMVVTATGLVGKSGASNDVDISLLTITGEGANSYTITSTADVEITSATQFTLTLSGSDKTNIDGLLNKNGTASDASSTSYNLAAGDNWLRGAATSVDISDPSNNAITVSNVSVPTITAANYDASTGVLVVTGTNLRNFSGANNDVDISKLTFTGDNAGTYTVTSASDVEISSSTQFNVTLTGADKTNIDGLLNKNGTTSDVSTTTYNLAAADNWMPGAAASTDISDATGNGITVSNVTTPTISSATYDFTTAILVVTGTNFRNKNGASNDIDVTKLSLKGEGANSYTLTSSNVDITSATAFSVTLSETDKINLNGLLNKAGTSADDATVYNLAAADNWMPAALTATDIADTTASISVSNINIPTITSMTYDHNTGILTVTGSNFVKKFGSNNDIDISTLTFTGENGQTYTITSAVDVEITSATSFTITLTGADLTGVNNLVSANGTTAASGAAYNIAAADNWMAGTANTTNIADVTTAVTVSNAPVPTVTAATYNATTGVLTVTGTNFVAKAGALNDVSVSKLTLKGEGASTYTLTTSDVEITNSSSFAVTLSALDKRSINGLLNKDGTSADDATAYNLAAADDFIAQITAGDSSDAVAAVTVSNVVAPTVTSATFDAATGVLVVTGTNLAHKPGATNDIDISTLTLTGEGNTSYTITSASDVEITSDSQFSITLSAVDLLNIKGLLNKNGTSSDDVTSYNLATADNWAMGAANSTDIADATNPITVSNVAIPTITSATYDYTAANLVVTGTNFSSKIGATNDVDISLLTFTGEAGATYTLTSASDVEVTSTTSFSVALSGLDQTSVAGLLNKNGSQSDNSATTYNLAAADNWMRGAASTTDIADATSGITVSNVTTPTITAATYDGTTGVMVVTATNLASKSGASNDITVSKLSLIGQGGASYTLTSGNVEITSTTAFSVTLNSADKTNLAVLLNKNGVQAVDNTSYNLAAADDWLAGAAASANIADLTANGVTVSNVTAPTVTLSVNSNTMAEVAGTAVVTATLSAATSNNVTVNLGYSGTATNIADYTRSSTILISAGQLSGTATLTAVADAVVEASETVIIDITSIDNNAATENGVQQQTVSILDDDQATVSLSVNNSTIAEAAGTATLTATLSQASYANVTVNLGYTGTATSGTDYATPAASITIAAGQTIGTATLTATADTSVEANETIIVDITSVSGGSAVENGTQQQTVTITDDDSATVSIAVNNATMLETGGASTVTATLSQATYENVTVSLGYTGTATSGIDYATPASSITITAGQTTGTATLTATSDTSVEANETIIVDVTSVSGGKITENGTQQQTVTITDDDSATVSIAVNNATMLETGGTSTVTATLSQATYENVTVSLGYTGTAASGTDYATPASSITITAGQTTGTATLTATSDTSVEANETIIMDVTGVSGGKITENGTQQQTVTITDDDTATVTLTASSTSLVESTGASTLTVSLNKPSYAAVSVVLAYSGTATTGVDYATPTTSVTIAAGQTSATAAITVINDATEEPDETIVVDIASVSGGSAVESGVQQQTLTIVNDDDQTAPQGYSVKIDAININLSTQNAMSFSFSGAEIGSTYSYTVTDSATAAVAKTPLALPDYLPSATFNGSGVVTASNQTITGIDVSGLADGQITLAVTLTDLSGNVGASASATVNKDTQAPTATVTSTTSNPTNGPIELSFNFSETVTGFALTDLTLVNATAANLSGSGSSYKATITPVADGSVSVDLGADAVVDAASNGNLAATTFTTVYDKTAPLLQSVSPTNNAVDVSTKPTLTLTFNENITAGSSDNLINIKRESDDVTVFSLAANDPSVSVSGQQASLTLSSTLAGAKSYYVNIAAGAFVDSATNTYAGISGKTTWRFSVISSVPLTESDVATVDEDNQITVAVLANDTGIDAVLNPASVTVKTTPAHGSTSVNTANGNVTYTPAANYHGTDTFEYLVSDLNGTVSANTSVTITINSVNDAPVAVNDSATVAEDEAALIDVVLNDTDVDANTDIDSGTIKIVTAPTNGQATVINGKVNYQGAANFSGSDTFSYTVSDQGGLVSNTAIVTINVSSSNDAPVAVADTATTDEEQAVTIDVLVNDSDIDGTLNVESVAIVSAPGNGSASVNPDGTITYTPVTDFFGIDSFSYTVSDDIGALSGAAVVSVTVNNINDAPVANNDTVVLLEDAPHSINVIGNDIDVDSAISSVQLTSQPQNGSVSVNTTDLNIVYTPSANFNGSDSFSYQISDAQGATSNTATVTLTVEAVNDLPTVNNDTIQVSEDSSVDIDVLANDSDIDGQLDPASVEVISQPVSGVATVQSNGHIVYAPNANFVGDDTFIYQVSDDQGAVDSATVFIQIINSNDAPVAVDLVLNTNEDQSLTVALQGSDPDGDNLSYLIKLQPSNGTLSGQAPTLTYQPNAQFNGSDSFSYSVSDGVLESNVATVTIAVVAVNDVPVADSQTVQLLEDGNINIVLSGSDIDGDVLSYSVVSQPSNGQLSGTVPNLVYTPNPNFNGSDSFNFTVNDGQTNSAAATVQINVTSVNDLPVANPLSLTLNEDQSRSFKLSGSDLDGDGLTFNILTAPLHGQLNGQSPSLIYTPDGNFNGDDSFTFEAHDGLTGSLPITVPITVAAVNDSPLAIDDQVNRDNWLAFELDVLANDSDVDGDTLVIRGAKVNTGSVTFSGSRLTYTPVNGFIGAVLVDYSIGDGHGGTDAAQATINFTVSTADLPVITPPPTVEVNANALSTKVDLGVATAVDRLGNPIAVSLDGRSTFFKPGVTSVYWKATDSEGRTSVASQTVKVHPLISVDKDQTLLEGYSATMGIRLNGTAPSYPLTIPFNVSGTATPGVDHDLVSGSVVIKSGTEGEIKFNVFSDNVFEGDETIIIELSADLNRGAKFQHTVTISESNVNPKVELVAVQAGEQRFIVNIDDGIVLVKSVISHPDRNNHYDFNWSNKQGILVDLDNVESTFSFDPTGLELGIYHLTLNVVDQDDPSYKGRKQVTMKLEQNGIVLTGGDSDSDGVPDDVEGIGDGDNDGIPDYLDSISECNVVQESIATDQNFLLEGDPGVCMRLGDVALGGQTGGARVLSGDLLGDSDTTNIGGVFDFIAYGLPVQGQSYRVVLPQAQPIPANAVYRKISASGLWQDFVQTSEEQLWSTAGELGYCPPPGDSSWQAGLNEGHWCVQLVIADGGPNDADGIANSTIVDPGGVAVTVTNNSLPVVVNDQAQTRLNTPVLVDVLANDSDADGDTLHISSANAAFGTVAIENDKLYYQPALDYFGLDTVVYGISDGQGGSGSATLTMTVLVNANPVTSPDSATTLAGQLVNINVLGNDTDAENDPLSVIAATAEHGTVVIESDQTLSYRSDSDFVGIDTIQYRISDALGGEAIGTVSVNVTAATTEVKVHTSGGGALFWMLLVYLSIGLIGRSPNIQHLKKNVSA